MAELFAGLLELGAREANEIARQFPNVVRRVGGYNIDALTSPDVNMDMTVDVRDLYAHFESPSDINCDTQIDGADAVALRDAIRLNESSDIDAR